MNVEHLQRILTEYRPSMRLVVTVAQEKMMETTVAEMITILMPQPRDECFSFFGLSECIIRERGEPTEDVAGAPPYREWLELDMR
jgi:hypothetical protein